MGAAVVIHRRKSWHASAHYALRGLASSILASASALLAGCTSTASPPLPTTVPNLKPFVRIDGKPSKEARLAEAKATCRRVATSNPAHMRSTGSPTPKLEASNRVIEAGQSFSQATGEQKLDERKVSAIAAQYDACMVQNGYVRS